MSLCPFDALVFFLPFLSNASSNMFCLVKGNSCDTKISKHSHQHRLISKNTQVLHIIHKSNAKRLDPKMLAKLWFKNDASKNAVVAYASEYGALFLSLHAVKLSTEL
uniref:Putative secreted protein n=1 Tax=Rhipicephalus microplus TaxID=6941 RepID=A0A6M2DAC5_RHIMP